MKADWTKVERIYHAALELPVTDRMAFLSNACGSDAELRREVESLLAQASAASGFLDRPAVEAASRLMAEAPDALIGRQIGVYRVVSFLGAGGMGEVYRARDTKLGRDVALKVLPAMFTADRDRLARFEREARFLATLNHPHIGAIYGFEGGDEVRALVLELVEGETLADRLAHQAHGSGLKAHGLPSKTTLDIARQISEALEAAHEKGVIHRDLKPANIKITPDGVVKVLDFGMAKAAVGDGSTPELTQSPTVTVGGTREGVIVGTAAYMSPEQARGQAVDKRTDIWAFGCVLYEMVTGVSPFSRATMTDTLAAVVDREPDWTLLPSELSADVRQLLHRCLDKDRQRRLRDIGEARLKLEGAQREATGDVLPTTGPAPRARAGPGHGSQLRWRRVVAGAGAAAVLTLGVTAWRMWPLAQRDAGPQIRSLAVLPLRSLTENPAEDYIGLAVADSIIMSVSGRAGAALAVSPTSAVRGYLSVKTDALTFAKELGVDAVLEGTCHREGDQLRVSLNLLRVSDGISMWSESRDVRAGNMFAIQDQLADQIASRLRVELTPVQAGAKRRGTENEEANYLYYKGRFYFGERANTVQARANSDAATSLFEQAVDLDPAFADAHAMLAFAYAWTAVFMGENQSLIARAEHENALAEGLNDGLGQIHLTRGFILFSWYRGWRLVDAIREVRLAVALDPGLSDNELGALFLHVGLFDEWEAANQRSIDLDPTNQHLKRTFVHEFFLINRPDDGLTMQRRLFPQDQARDVRYFLATRRVREAGPRIEAALKKTPTGPTEVAQLALLRALQGRHAEAQELVPGLLKILLRDRNYHHYTYAIAQVYALGGNVDDTVHWLSETVNSGFPCYPLLDSDTFLDPVRNAPQFKGLMLRLRSQFDEFRAEVAAPVRIR